MDKALTVVIPVAVAVIAFWLWWSLYWEPRQKRREYTGELVPRKAAAKGARTCPLCSSPMPGGERVKSAVFPGKGYKLTHIFGCPACYPPNTLVKRICPVCLKEVPREGHVIARMFDRPGRIHVHVMGCTRCRLARPENR
jgi:hypothetical protein